MDWDLKGFKSNSNPYLIFGPTKNIPHIQKDGLLPISPTHKHENWHHKRWENTYNKPPTIPIVLFDQSRKCVRLCSAFLMHIWWSFKDERQVLFGNNKLAREHQCGTCKRTCTNIYVLGIHDIEWYIIAAKTHISCVG